MKTNKNKATHVGECQICGRVQMLPNGKLSNHGYTVRCGFFSGICQGAGHLPFEQSQDAIAPVVAAVTSHVKSTEQEIAGYRNIDNELNSGNMAWFSVYTGRAYSFAKCDVEIKENVSASGDGYKWLSVTRSAAPGESKTNQRPRVELYSFKFSTVREVVHHCNETYAKHLASTNRQRRDWLSWQNDRLKDWKVKPLQLRTKKSDKLA